MDFDKEKELHTQIQYRLIEKLSESEKRYRELVENLYEIVFETDSQGNLIFINSAWTEYLGYNIFTSLGKPLQEFIHPNDCNFNLISDFINIQKPIKLKEIRFCDQNHQLVWFEMSAWINFKQGLSGSLVNITQRKQAEEKICQALEKEKELNQLKSRFISMASHEFRTPLAIISSSAGILQNFSDRLSAEKKQAHLETIQKTIRHITQILDDVLMINRAEADTIELRLEELDIIAFCYHLQGQIEATTKKHRINFSHNLDKQTSNTSFIVQFDKKLLQQILTNLLTNAAKYSPNSDSVNFSLIKENNKLIFTIADHGMGIPEEDQANLFDSFHRGSNVGSIAGTGLGLAIVKRCVDLHQGEITFSSKLGEGTTFTVVIPCLKS